MPSTSPRSATAIAIAAALAPVLTLGIGAALLALFPEAEVACFAQGTARLAGCLAASPVNPTPEGWVFAAAGRPVLVSELCSATGFFQIVATLLAWHLARRGIHPFLTPVVALAAALPVTLAVNALRVVALAHVHHCIVPLLPENWSAFAHMTTGIALFLPSLIALERHAGLHTSR